MDIATYNLGAEINKIPDFLFRDSVNQIFVEVNFNFKKEFGFKYLVHEDVYDNLDMIAVLKPDSEENENEIKSEAKAKIISEEKIRKYLPIIREANQKMQIIGTSKDKEGLARALDVYLQFYQSEFGKRDALEIFLAESLRSYLEKTEGSKQESQGEANMGKVFDIKSGERIG